ncbi:hypothetical protein C8J56DRAFT_954432 [Mycena floridula]|nr:hypothetical protein C8J56DRAFT_954432 [Mycena floridula]
MATLTVNVPRTFGALLLGGLFASVLSGTVTLQTWAYFRGTSADYWTLKALVISIWILDTGHTAFIWSAIWDYLIENYGIVEQIDSIPWSLALSIVFTAILTFAVHCFFAHRIFKLSQRNWYLTTPIVILAVLRLASASVTTGEMIRLGTFSQFRKDFRWVFTLGLALSSSVDFIITGSMFVLLQHSRTGAERLNEVIDSLILYTFETGSLTCAVTIVSMICWIAIPTNLVFMGLHFIIGKLYATSFLVTLNTRSRLRRGASESYVYSGDNRGAPMMVFGKRRIPKSDGMMPPKTTELQVSVERSVQYTVEQRQYTDMYYRN